MDKIYKYFMEDKQKKTRNENNIAMLQGLHHLNKRNQKILELTNNLNMHENKEGYTGIGREFGIDLKSFNKKVHAQPADLIGYLEEKNSLINIKIRDQTSSLEGAKKQDKRQIKTGSVCGNEGMRKEKIISFIKNSGFGDDKLKTYFNKELLCKQLEIYLLSNDINKTDDKRWFYTLEETIEYDLAKK